MKIGLIDVDGHNYPNLPLMKLSAWHKSLGHQVGWYNLFMGHCDRVYMAKVFSFTPDYNFAVDADEIIKGGSGYCIRLENGREIYDKGIELPLEVEHIYPDYSLYPDLTKDTAYGFLTRGCPRGCGFCHVQSKEGGSSRKVADLSEFWQGQKNIILCDPNILASPDCKDLLKQIIASKARVDFNQGLDIRLLTEETAELLMQCKTNLLHFAWDRNEDLSEVFERARPWLAKKSNRNLMVYVLTNFDTTNNFDLRRIYTLRKLGYEPYVMIYNKPSAKRFLRTMQRWCNKKWIFYKCPDFKDYWYRQIITGDYLDVSMSEDVKGYNDDLDD